MKGVDLLLVAASLLSGCGGSTTEKRVSAPSPAVAPAPSASPSPELPRPDAQTEAEIQEALRAVVAVRKLEALTAVKSHVIPREELAAQMKRDVLADLDPILVRGITENLYALGAVPADHDYLQTILVILGSQLAGYYDPRDKAMFLLDDLGADGAAATLWHELVHALQDQHYDLQPKLKWSPGRGDSMSAVQALAEGDATSAMLDVMLAPQGQTALDLPAGMLGKSMGVIEALPELDGVPPILKRSLVAAYADGLAFVNALRERGGFAAVDAAWRDLPTSTEQILHPEKYEKREGPIAVLPPPPPEAGPKTMLFLDVLGEQGLRFVFEEWMPLVSAASAASGWGGDQLAVFAEGDRRAVGVHLVLDDETRAKETFEAIMRGVLAGEPEDSTGAKVEREQAAKLARLGRACRERPRRGPFAAVRVGRDLGVALGPFRRDGATTKSDGDCAAGLRWATAIAKSAR
jgi:hypothetical protein